MEDGADRIRTVVAAGALVILHGYGRLRVLPSFGPVGYWRCVLHADGHADRVLFRYSESSGGAYLACHGDEEDHGVVSAEILGRMIKAAVATRDAADLTGPVNPEYAEWLHEFTTKVAEGFVPSALSDDGPPGWWMHHADGRSISWPAPPGWQELGLA